MAREWAVTSLRPNVPVVVCCGASLGDAGDGRGFPATRTRAPALREGCSVKRDAASPITTRT